MQYASPLVSIDQYEVKVIHTGSHFVKIAHASGEIVLKLFPENRLISGDWWLKDIKGEINIWKNRFNRFCNRN